MYLSPKNLQAEMQREKIVKRFGCQAALDSLLFRWWMEEELSPTVVPVICVETDSLMMVTKF
jgi:hypothetical protein